MSYRKILMLVTLIVMPLLTVTAIRSQEVISTQNSAGVIPTIPVASSIAKPTNVDDCEDRVLSLSKRLDKALADLDASDAQILARDAEIVNKDLIIAKQEARFIEIIQILKEYAALDNKAKKGFWKKVGEKLVKYVDVLTDPATIREVLLVIAVIKAGK